MSFKKALLFAVGGVFVVAGVTLTLKDWVYIQLVFRGVIGPLLAVIGMVVLVMGRD